MRSITRRGCFGRLLAATDFSSFGTAFCTAFSFGTAELDTKPISFIDAVGTALGTAILSAERRTKPISFIGAVIRTKPISFIGAVIDANYY